MKITAVSVRVRAGIGLVSAASTSLELMRASAQEQTAQEQTIACEKIPAAVRTAFQDAYPQATIRGCAKEVEKGRTAYEISSTEGKTGHDVLFYEDGTPIVIEETIDIADLPEAVRKAWNERFAAHAVELVERVMRDTR